MSKPEKKHKDKQPPAEAEAAENTKQPEPAADAAAREKEVQAKLDEMRDKMMRGMADADNMRKRALKEIEEANRYGISSLAKELIIVLENLSRAIDTAPAEDENTKKLIEGIELTRKELLNIFERRGIKRIEPKPGEKFDHNFHQAVTQVEDAKFEPGTIIQVVQAGYMIHDRLLRPAMVTVSKGAAQPPAPDAA